MAIWAEGGVVIPMDSRWGTGLRASILRHSGAELRLRFRKRWIAERIRNDGNEHPPLPDHTAFLSYTSGSTSDPKGVILTHDNIHSAYSSGASSLVKLLGRTPLVMGCPMRLSGMGALAIHYLWALVLGFRIVVLPEPSLTTAGRFWDAFVSASVDLSFMPPMQIDLLNKLSVPNREPPAATVMTGSAPLTARIQKRFQAQFGVPLLNCYGLTEVAFPAFFGNLDTKGLGTLSIGEPSHEARINTDGDYSTSGAARGELQMRGRTVTPGYYNNSPANSALFDGDWLRTGDLLERDEEGRHWVVGRIKDAVMKGGFTVYLNEVEEAATALEEVAEAGAVRLDRADGLEDIGLIVRPNKGSVLSVSQIETHLEEWLGRGRSPSVTVLTNDPLPRVTQGKLDRGQLSSRWDALRSEVASRERTRQISSPIEEPPA